MPARDAGIAHADYRFIDSELERLRSRYSRLEMQLAATIDDLEGFIASPGSDDRGVSRRAVVQLATTAFGVGEMRVARKDARPAGSHRTSFPLPHGGRAWYLAGDLEQAQGLASLATVKHRSTSRA